MGVVESLEEWCELTSEGACGYEPKKVGDGRASERRGDRVRILLHSEWVGDPEVTRES